MGSEPEGTLRRRRAPLLIGSILAVMLSLALGGAAAAQTSTADVDWDRLAQCSSNGVWNQNLGYGVYGGLSILQITWDGFGGREFASRPDLATREQQITVARRILAGQGWEIAWPGCGALLGYAPTRTPTDVTEASELPTTEATAPPATTGGTGATDTAAPATTDSVTTAPVTSAPAATSSPVGVTTAVAATTAASVPAASTGKSSGGSIVLVIVLLLVVAAAIVVFVVSRRRRQEGAAWPVRTEVEAIPTDLVQQMFEQRRMGPEPGITEPQEPVAAEWLPPAGTIGDGDELVEAYDESYDEPYDDGTYEPLPPPRWQPARPPAERPARRRAAPGPVVPAPATAGSRQADPGVSSKRFVPALADAADRISHEQLTEQWRRADAQAAEQQRRALETRLREVEQSGSERAREWADHLRNELHRLSQRNGH